MNPVSPDLTKLAYRAATDRTVRPEIVRRGAGITVFGQIGLLLGTERTHLRAAHVRFANEPQPALIQAMATLQLCQRRNRPASYCLPICPLVLTC